jgi:hypothetical protein
MSLLKNEIISFIKSNNTTHCVRTYKAPTSGMASLWSSDGLISRGHTSYYKSNSVQDIMDGNSNIIKDIKEIVAGSSIHVREIKTVFNPYNIYVSSGFSTDIILEK